jgi:hypothetical protein
MQRTKREMGLMKNVSAEVCGGLMAAIMAAVMGSWQIVVVVCLLFALTLIGNLVTGLLLAFQTNSYSEEKARKAVYKKGGLITGIIVLILVDWMVMGMARSGGITYNIPFFAMILAGYSAVHEFASMLSNIKTLGNHVPAAIQTAAQKAEQALDQGKLPDLADIIGKDGGGK